MTTAPSRSTAKKTAAAPKGTTLSGAQASGQASQKSLQQHLVTLTECDVMDPQGLYEFCEAMRVLATAEAFFAHVASTQLDHAARKAARDAGDGRLTLAQKTKLRIVLRRISRQVNSGVAEALLDAAKSAVKAYGLMQEFADECESDEIDRPHRFAKGGFSMSRSR